MLKFDRPIIIFSNQLINITKAEDIEATVDCIYIEKNENWTRSTTSNFIMHPFSCRLYPINNDIIFFLEFLKLTQKEAEEIIWAFSEACLKMISIDDKNDQTGFNIINLNDLSNFINISIFYLTIIQEFHKKFRLCEKDHLVALRILFRLIQTKLNSFFINDLFAEYHKINKQDEYLEVPLNLTQFFKNEYPGISNCLIDESYKNYYINLSKQIELDLDHGNTNNLVEHIHTIADMGNHSEMISLATLSFHTYWLSRIISRLNLN
jgi:hypothetical protein